MCEVSKAGTRSVTLREEICLDTVKLQFVECTKNKTRLSKQCRKQVFDQLCDQYYFKEAIAKSQVLYYFYLEQHRVLNFKVLRSFLALRRWILVSNNEDLFFCKKTPTSNAQKLGLAPYRLKIEVKKTNGLQYAKEPARAHSFNAKNDNSNGPPQPKI